MVTIVLNYPRFKCTYHTDQLDQDLNHVLPLAFDYNNNNLGPTELVLLASLAETESRFVGRFWLKVQFY